ncbi:MAG: hypothetical protein IPI67_11100 [Myxococcales bacterium]|nr:hypothetical protein [Myxococcales bacterium]
MRKTVALFSLAFWLIGCGGDSTTEGTGGSGGATGGSGATGGGATGGAGGTGGGSGGTTGGSGGVTAGAGGTTGGSGGTTGGSGGATGGSGGATGGSGGATGGSGGATGGSGGATGGSGGATSKPECASDSDCKILQDCCSCSGYPSSETPPSCAKLCIQDKCGELGVTPTASCQAGRCVAGFNCDPSKVTCKSLTPTCNPGEIPLINAAGNCWQGGCVPANECKAVKACSDCTGNLVCASWVTQLGTQHHCVDVPKSCGTDFTCGCMGPSVCTSPYLSCQDYSGQKGVSCSCPNC